MTLQLDSTAPPQVIIIVVRFRAGSRSLARDIMAQTATSPAASWLWCRADKSKADALAMMWEIHGAFDVVDRHV